MLLRFLAKSSHYHGAITLKFYDGKVTNIKAEDSYDIGYLNSLSYTIEMLKKQGAGNSQNSNEGKILSTYEANIKAQNIDIQENLKSPNPIKIDKKEVVEDAQHNEKLQ